MRNRNESVNGVVENFVFIEGCQSLEIEVEG